MTNIYNIPAGVKVTITNLRFRRPCMASKIGMRYEHERRNSKEAIDLLKKTGL